MDDILEKFEKYKKYSIDNFEEIKYPIDFFRVLKSKLKNAENATIFSMYAGEDDLAKELLDIIVEREKTGKKTKVVLDKNRGLTEKLKNFIKLHNLKCFTFKGLNTINLFRFNEVSAVFHSKLYMFDNEIILSGANLDNSYFKNRLDRYFIIKNEDLCSDLRVGFPSMIECKKSQTYLFKYGRQEEKEVLEKILDYDFDAVYVSSAYFNPPPEYYKLFKKQKNLSFFVNHPQFNIFTNFGFFGSFVTAVYQYSSYYALKILPNSVLYEFGLDGYSMHKKGLWAFKNGLCVTILGSSNFNRRSYERDEELNFCVVTEDPKSVALFKNEIDFLKSYSIKTKLEHFKFNRWKIIYMVIFFIFNRYF